AETWYGFSSVWKWPSSSDADSCGGRGRRSHDRSARPDPRVRRTPSGRRSDARGPKGLRVRIPRTERGRQDHDREDALHGPLPDGRDRRGGRIRYPERGAQGSLDYRRDRRRHGTGTAVLDSDGVPALFLEASERLNRRPKRGTPGMARSFGPRGTRQPADRGLFRRDEEALGTVPGV